MIAIIVAGPVLDTRKPEAYSLTTTADCWLTSRMTACVLELAWWDSIMDTYSHNRQVRAAP